MIDLNYEKQKAEAVLRAQSQTLVLHGLSEEQVADILKTRKLLPKLSVAGSRTWPPTRANVQLLSCRFKNYESSKGNM